MLNKRVSRRTEMAEEVETFLQERLDEAITQAENDPGSSSSKLFRLTSDFKNLRDMIKNKDECLQDETKRRGALFNLHNLFTEWQMISKKHGIHKPEALMASYRLSESLQKVKRDLKGEIKQGEEPALTTGKEQGEAPPSVPADNFETYRWSSRYEPEKVYGLEHNKKLMERLLVRKEIGEDKFKANEIVESPGVGKTAEFKAIAIVGIPGVGKTALCQVMFNQKAVKQHYNVRIWVCLSRQQVDDADTKKEAVKRILLCLGVDRDVIDLAGEDKNKGLSNLILALRLQLIGKKYLIVLDDASSEDKFFENLSSDDDKQQELLAYGLPKDRAGSTVLVTARSEKLAKKMVGEDNVHQLPLLKKKELCWDIFKDTVMKGVDKEFTQEEAENELEGLKDLVVKKCGGLPLSATMMGEIMRKNLKEQRAKTIWQQRQLQSPLPRTQTR